MSDPLVLSFDTSAAHCAAALVRGVEVLSARAEAMNRGQAERLMPLLEDVLSEQSVEWSDLTAIGVGIGPGNFTGIRISVSAARGLALGLRIPTVGVSTFDASRVGTDTPVVATVSAPRDQIYVSDPSSGEAPFLTATPFESALPQIAPPDAQTLAINIARVAQTRYAMNPPRPAPLYIRSADAAPARDLPPRIL